MKPQSSTRHTPGATAIVEEEALLRQWSIEAPSGSPRKITQVVRSWVIHLCRRLSSTDRNPSRYLLQNSTGCSLRRLVRRCRGKRVKDSIHYNYGNREIYVESWEVRQLLPISNVKANKSQLTERQSLHSVKHSVHILYDTCRNNQLG